MSKTQVDNDTSLGKFDPVFDQSNKFDANSRNRLRVNVCYCVLRCVVSVLELMCVAVCSSV